MLKETFQNLLYNFTDDAKLINTLWTEIEKNYCSKKRHYHTLQHLDKVLVQLIAVKEKLKDWNSILFTLYYHDIVYNALKTDNEEKSAAFAENCLKHIGVPNDTIERCKKHIIATQSHAKAADSDTNYFTDADLSVLGQSWEDYTLYYKNVRKEYAIYPDFMYNPGRKKVIHHFLAMDNIYKTGYFYDKYELQARKNLTSELAVL